MQVKMSAISKQKNYESTFVWPPDCYLQAGDRGIVFHKDDSYHTAFFEAFPNDPDTFIRGEGATVAEAEQAAWEKWKSILACIGHEFWLGGYKNGAGFCRHCNLFKPRAFPPSETCCVCGEPTYYTGDSAGNWYCVDHERDKPLALWTELDWHIAYTALWAYCPD